MLNTLSLQGYSGLDLRPLRSCCALSERDLRDSKLLTRNQRRQYTTREAVQGLLLGLDDLH